MVIRVDIGIFAYNEASNIAAVIDTLRRQDAFARPDFDLCLHVLANGCTDQTCALAEAALETASEILNWQVYDLQPGGKSHTWNRFVHQLSRPEADVLMFCDADIWLPEPGTMRGLVQLLQAEPERHATVSLAVKDIERSSAPLGLMGRFIAQSAGTLNNWQHSICGQLYTLRAEVARGFHMPIGLPVEDGFVRAMVCTAGLTEVGQNTRIFGKPEFFHVYTSERSPVMLLRHQIRIVIGSAINSVLFDVLSREPDRSAADILRQVHTDPEWLGHVLHAELPRRYGYVPRSFLTKRLRKFSRGNGLKRNVTLLLGFGFDAVVYVLAQWRMLRGTGAGFW